MNFKKYMLGFLLISTVFISLNAQSLDVKHSIVQWSFRVPLDYLMEQAKPLGVTAIELVGPEKWDKIKKQGFDVLVADGADLGIERGFANPEFHKELIERYKKLIPQASKADIRYVICYSGLNTSYTSEEAMENCVSGLKDLLPIAKKNNVVLLMELISSKEGKELFFKQSFPHYAANSAEWGAKLCDKLTSDNFKLLYDVWQMYDMGNDVFADVEKYHSYIAHYHVAGIANRKPFKDNEPIDFKKLTKTIYSTGYTGYIGHEYMIEKDVPQKLKAAIKLLNYKESVTPPFDLKYWGDSLVYYAITNYMPACHYNWNWREATLLRSFINLYEEDTTKKDAMLKYITTAMELNMNKANGNTPNALASGVGLAFLSKVSNDNQFKIKSLELFEEYKLISRASNGGVSHRKDVVELWDDTVYMIGLYLLEMYKSTHDEKYLNELTFQIIAHNDKLGDKKTGLWYHGWDNDSIITDDGCCQLGWSNNPMHRNDQFWGRGNGWIAMTLADVLAVMPQKYSSRAEILAIYQKMMNALVPLQDKVTGHWFQLPIHPEDFNKGNFIESSCTAMFGYAMAKGLKLGILPEKIFLPVIKSAYTGISKNSIKAIGNYKTISNVCAGTCIGDKSYYYKRNVEIGTEFGLGAAIMFGNAYNQLMNH